MCRQGGGRRPSPPLDASTGRRVLPAWRGSGRRRALDAFPALYGEKMTAEQPWPSALGEMGLAYRFLPGVGMSWGQEPVLMAQRSPLGASVRLGNATDPKCCGPFRWPRPSDHPDSSAGFLQWPLSGPLALPLLQAALCTRPECCVPRPRS